MSKVTWLERRDLRSAALKHSAVYGGDGQGVGGTMLVLKFTSSGSGQKSRGKAFTLWSSRLIQVTFHFSATAWRPPLMPKTPPKMRDDVGCMHRRKSALRRIQGTSED